MGVHEREQQKRMRHGQLRHVVLQTVAAAGLISAALIAPNAVGAMVQLGLVPSRRHKDSVQQARARLVKQGLLKYEGGFLRLTKKGETELASIDRRERYRTTPNRWDKKWRVLIFDIPERRKGVRQKVRAALMSIGFVRLQDSVWLYPYDCEDFVVLLKADFKIGKDMLYMIVDTIEADSYWREYFGLPDR